MIRRYLTGFFLLGVASLPLAVQAQAPANNAAQTAGKFWTDDFSDYAVDSDASPHWDAQDIGYSISSVGGNKVLTGNVASGRGVMLWHAVPYARALRFEVNVTPQVATGRPVDWKTTGIGLYTDESNYWHVAFVEAPQANDSKHFIELSEMFQGTWNAQSEKGTALKSLGESAPFDWKYGTTYRVRLILSREGATPTITGEVWEGDQLRWKSARVLESEDGQQHVVSAGRPMVSASGFSTQFQAPRVEALEAAPEPSLAPTTYPAFASVTLPKIKGIPSSAKRTGFFRVAKTGDRWWLYDPNGQPSLAVGTDHVNYNVHFSEAMGYAPYHRNVEKKYGTEAAWAQEATNRLKAWNFNILGTNNSPATNYRGLPYTRFMSFGSDFSATAAVVEKTFWTGFPDVFDPRWVRFCELRAKQRCLPNRNDPWLLGYFLDNELEWFGKSHEKWGMALDAVKQPATSYGKRALGESLRKSYNGDIAAFNSDFKTQLTSWDGFLELKEIAAPATDRSRAALMQWVAEVAQRYYEVATAAIRHNDPNHLIIGNRFAGDAPDAAWEWAGKTCDIVTVNTYPRVNFTTRKVQGLDDLLQTHYKIVNKPMMVTEWSFPALDAKDSSGKLIPSKHGAGMRVDTQAQKAQAFAIMQEALLRTPFVVGSFYFMWADEPAAGISSSFPEDSNYGLVNENDEPYPELTAMAKQVNAQAYAIHAGTPLKWDTLPVSNINTSPIKIDTLLQPNSTVTLQRDGDNFTVDNGPLRLQSSTGSGALQVSARKDGNWVNIGRYNPTIHEVVNGQNLWIGADKLEKVEVQENTAKRFEADLTFALSPNTTNSITELKDGVNVPQTSVPQPWRAQVHITLEAGQPWFEARYAWIENTGPTAWEWKEYYHYTPPQDTNATNSIQDVPNYWMSVGAWRDPGSGLHFGVVPLKDDERVNINFWKDEKGGSFHPDARRLFSGRLAPKERWTADKDEPSFAVFVLQETGANPHPWTTLAANLRSLPAK